MAIKIIREGTKTFSAFCERCGCEFTYELTDLKLSGSSSDKVACPTCGKDFYHKSLTKTISEPYQPSLQKITWPPEPIPCVTDKADTCDGCAWKENLMRNGMYVGDTPCTWCNKNRWNYVTCDTKADNLSDIYKMASVTKLDTYLDAVDATPTESSGIKYQIYGSSCCENRTNAKAVDGVVTTTICSFGDHECKYTDSNGPEGPTGIRSEHKCRGK